MWMVAIIIIIGLFFFIMAAPNVQPKAYEIERFMEAKETIYSPITVEDEKETNAKIQKAVQAVEEQYTVSSSITDERVEYIHEVFEAADKVMERKVDGDAEENKETVTVLSPSENLKKYEELLSDEIITNISSDVLTTILMTPKPERDEAERFLEESIKAVMVDGVKSDNLNQKQIEMRRIILYSNFTGSLQKALTDIGVFAIEENAFFDAEKTMQQRREAASLVEPVMIRAGDKLVDKGETITSEIYEDLGLAGVLKDQRNYLPYIGLGLFTLLLCGLLLFECFRQEDWDKNTLFTVLFISIGSIAIMKVFSYFDTNELQLYLAIPAAASVMIIKWLVNERFAIVIATIYALMGTILLNFQMPGYFNVEAGIYILASQWAGIYFFKNSKDRGEILRVGFGVFMVNAITITTFLLISFTQINIRELLILLGFALCSAFLSTVLTLGLMPFFEAGLNILSESKLLSLSNPNHPLLRKILVETPGTYHHSIMVANLSEAACEAIGANGLLARVASYYHDIGKSVNPQYFIENQMGEKNPHDLLKPEQSAKIIINHPYDGAFLLKEYKLPKEIIDIAEQHHGKTLLKYFYYKAKENNPNVKEEQYRYPGPKPQTKEAAIVCICDSVEAAVRSMGQPSMDKIEDVVKAIIHDRLTDGQLNECPLTLQDLSLIQTAVCEMLKGIFHSRIEYPGAKLDEVKKEAN